jgi:predicted Zn-dependent peptidase
MFCRLARSIRLVALAAGVSASLAFVPLQAAASEGGVPSGLRLSIPHQRVRLANGLTVILHENHTTPEVVVNLMYRVGSKDERPGRTGFAHLFEHLMFMGSTHVPNGEFDRVMERQGGVNNATTSEDRTSYFEMGPSHLLETFLWLEAERLATLPNAMTPKKLDLQREIVKDERRQSMENQPYGGIELALPELLYPKGHPYHHHVIGSHADLSAARVGDVTSFFRTYYVPSNASLVIAGDIDPAAALALAEKWFGWMPRQAPPRPVSAPPVQLDRSLRRTLTDAVEHDRVHIAWHSAASFAPGDAAADLLAMILGGQQSARLMQKLVFERKLASELKVSHEAGLLGGTFSIVATAAPGHRAAEVETALRAELAQLFDGTAPLTPAELVRARTQVKTRRLHELDGLLHVAEALNDYELRFGSPAQIERLHLQRYDEVTVGDLAWEAWRIFGRPDATVTVVPKTPSSGGRHAR